MLDKMKQLMEMKKQADQIKRDLEGVVIEVSEVRGIKLAITGAQTLRSIEIDETLLNPANKSRLESDLLRSVNAAIRKSQQAAVQKMAAVMPGF